MTELRTLKVALLGCGNVGAQVARILIDDAEILAAMRNGACVVTGNKALVAKDGPTLHEEADKAGVQLSYEAAVAGAIPILRPIRDSLSGDRITRVLGIV